MVEHRAVAPGVAGSSPVGLPRSLKWCYNTIMNPGSSNRQDMGL